MSAADPIRQANPDAPTTVRPERQQLSGLGEAFRRLRPYFQDFRRDQPEQDERDWCGTEISDKRSR